jgi:hypothetical protein
MILVGSCNSWTSVVSMACVQSVETVILLVTGEKARGSTSDDSGGGIW